MLDLSKKYIVIDNFFDRVTYLTLKSYVINELDWLPLDNVATSNDSKFLHHGLSGIIFDSSLKEKKSNNLVVSLFAGNIEKYFHIDDLIRIRAGLQLPIGKELVHTPHCDFGTPHWTALFYFSTERNSGETYIYNEYFDPYKYRDVNDQRDKLKDKFTVLDKIEAVENRVLIFRGDVYHSSSAPQKINRRYAVNVNFKGFSRDG